MEYKDITKMSSKEIVDFIMSEKDIEKRMIIAREIGLDTINKVIYSLDEQNVSYPFSINHIQDRLRNERTRNIAERLALASDDREIQTIIELCGIDSCRSASFLVGMKSAEKASHIQDLIKSTQIKKSDKFLEDLNKNALEDSNLGRKLVIAHGGAVVVAKDLKIAHNYDSCILDFLDKSDDVMDR